MSYRTLSLLALACLLTGCAPVEPPPPPVAVPIIPPKDVPDYLRGSVWEHVDVGGLDPMRVSGFGLVVNLDGTGDTRAPNPVRDYMVKLMQKHGFGNINVPGMGALGPERVLNDKDKRTAIVRVDGFIPPGARKDQLFDVQVSALENSNTSSLHRGVLYTTDLSPRGADPRNPGAAGINTYARVSGPIFVNPTFAIDATEANAAQRMGLRTGIVMGRGINLDDRPLVLKLRQPDRRIARLIERRVQEHFQDGRAASMQSEGDVWVTMPPSFNGDYERFAGVVSHLFLNSTTDFAVLKARKLVEVALEEKANAPLLNMTYAWEAMGPAAIAEIQKLYSHDTPDVVYAAARAGTFLGDSAAEETLARIARQADNPFQLASIKVLGQVKRNARIGTLLRDIIASDQLLARIEAYRAMVASSDPIIYSLPIREKFILDIVPTSGSPIIYASRVGTPRLALIGDPLRIANPTLFLCMQNRFSIVTKPESEAMHVFFRGSDFQPAADVQLAPELPVLIARLGGEGERLANGNRFDFGYTDIVGIVQRLADRGLLVPANAPAGKELAKVVFQMQELPGLDDPIMTAPPITPNEVEQRPTTRPAEIGTPPPAPLTRPSTLPDLVPESRPLR